MVFSLSREKIEEDLSGFTRVNWRFYNCGFGLFVENVLYYYLVAPLITKQI
jgi:hypothetical protein